VTSQYFDFREAESDTIGRYRHSPQSYGSITRKSPSENPVREGGELNGGNKNQPSKFERYNFHRSFTICVGSQPSSVNGDEIEEKTERKSRTLPHVSNTSLQIDCTRDACVYVRCIPPSLLLSPSFARRNRRSASTIEKDHDWNLFFDASKRKNARSSVRENQSPLSHCYCKSAE